MKTRTWAFWHGIVAGIIALPLLVTSVTGTFLILRKELTFMQPEASRVEKISIEEALPIQLITKSLPQKNWSSIILKPSKGIYQLRSTDGFEFHVNALNGKLLNQGAKRTGLFIRLHEGSFFGDWARKSIFLPAALGLLFLWFSGVFLFFKITLKRIKSKKYDDQEKLVGDLYERV